MMASLPGALPFMLTPGSFLGSHSPAQAFAIIPCRNFRQLNGGFLGVSGSALERGPRSRLLLPEGSSRQRGKLGRGDLLCVSVEGRSGGIGGPRDDGVLALETFLTDGKVRKVLAWILFVIGCSLLREFYGVIVGTFILSFLGNSTVSFLEQQAAEIHKFTVSKTKLMLPQLSRKTLSIIYIILILNLVGFVCIFTGEFHSRIESHRHDFLLLPSHPLFSVNLCSASSLSFSFLSLPSSRFLSLLDLSSRLLLSMPNHLHSSARRIHDPT